MVKSLGKSNELIARDEGMHTDFAILLYSKLEQRLDTNVINMIFRDAVGIEKEFICDSLRCDLLGMNKILMCQYIEFVADRLLKQLGYDKIFNATNPFSFMNQMNLDGKSNFFEQRVTEYKIDNDKSMENFAIDDDF